MKRLLLITGIILILYLILMTMAAPPTAAPSAQTVERQESGYRIGVSDGRVTVFRNGELYLRTDTPVSSLPRSDRTKLEEGIEINSLKELKERLEDYCS